MKLYRVCYYPDQRDIWPEFFDCWAEDAAHAIDQCRNAYPDAHEVGPEVGILT